jgi:DNA-binding transcriptional regulator YhcF (GntR family)
MSLVFHLNNASGVPVYVQLMDQVRHAVRAGTVVSGDQLPTVKDVVGMVPVNPNTVLRAYRELEHEGTVEIRLGRGTFVAAGSAPALARKAYDALSSRLEQWVADARRQGLDDPAIARMINQVIWDSARRRRSA